MAVLIGKGVAACIGHLKSEASGNNGSGAQAHEAILVVQSCFFSMLLVYAYADVSYWYFALAV